MEKDYLLQLTPFSKLRPTVLYGNELYGNESSVGSASI